MSKYWGVVIPGLAISADEMPIVPGLLVLDNPEIGLGGKLEGNYSIEDVAAYHIAYIQKHREIFTEEVKFIGMSMGGMILSIMASKFRNSLPKKSEFHFFVTSSNSAFTPAISKALFQQWSNADVKSFTSFRSVLEPLFSEKFLQTKSDVLDRYVNYRMKGGNRQAKKAFSRQLQAARDFVGEHYFPLIAPKEAFFVGGTEDRLFGPDHSAILKDLLPGASHVEIEGLGHMINLERPDLFNLK